MEKKSFLSHLGYDAYDQEANEEQDESMADIEPLPLQIKTFQEAIQSLEKFNTSLKAKDSCNKP